MMYTGKQIWFDFFVFVEKKKKKKKKNKKIYFIGGYVLGT